MISRVIARWLIDVNDDVIRHSRFGNRRCGSHPGACATRLWRDWKVHELSDLLQCKNQKNTRIKISVLKPRVSGYPPMRAPTVPNQQETRGASVPCRNGHYGVP